MTGQQHIVVVGAGYAGLSVATRAARHNRVTVVAPEARFLNRVRQHETAAGHREHRPAISAVLRGRNAVHVRDRVVELDLAGRKVFTAGGEAIGYDRLVYALGSRTAFLGVPGAAEHGFPVERAAELRDRMAAADRPGTVAVVGGGATGVELAAELAEAAPEWRVRLVTDGLVGGWLSSRGRAHVLSALARLGVVVHEEHRVTEVPAGGGVRTTCGPLEADLVAWAAAMEPHRLAAEAGLAVAPDGRAEVDRQLRSVSHPEVYVVGDAASVHVPGVGRPQMSCAAAGPMGRHVGRALAGRRPGKPFAFRYILQCLSLGRQDGLVQLLRTDGSMRQTVFTGTTARLVKAALVTGVVRALR
ncbi:NAD(P)/FAD-dependent oxidoreductase [Streptomyces alkaliterrae]|uniref:FAD-dependent oxidoreductase n=1 Tax=Streptomyces alkaliterrae TaxID=2213162 RepID=A0A5P0YZ58_9ACTN|nr:FAD-dependent oxidoreductase [Streptomyces alkaliterrae]MBB1252627.1 FAD-dependent oxidoreductase [Streptomyces alkaliterrae]MBB1257423.1 FAD-dependent oxidoreductase [Streptomyces alkaliterrae]MQS04837.1 hypothetical protein [Streptomyces alkaliterrae]